MLQRNLAAALSLAIAAVAYAPTAAEASPQPMSPRQLYKRFSKSVVLVFGTDGSAQGSAGTGSIISDDGQIITNAHVVMKNGRPYKRLFVYTKPKKLTGSMNRDLKHRHEVVLMDHDSKLDLALLRMKKVPDDLQPIGFADPDEVEIGEPVVAIGMPETGGLWTLTTGSISAVVANFNNVRGKDVFQTEASVNRGNSGGPLLNVFGHMVGINTSISRRAADGLAITDINFSLKSSVAVNWLRRRRLMTLAYATPGDVKEQTLVAMADPPPSRRKPKTYKVDAGDQKTEVVVVEPTYGQEVADDPEFMAAAESSNVVNRAVDAPKTRTRKPKKPEKVKLKQLTKPRPYSIDDFVDDRIKEMRAMENMMDEMRRDLDRRRGSRRRRPDSRGMGLW